ncbi:hypothetical protein EJ110_NYTH15672 [Nymphaea thermarum]|nr:hypothetical protein EJ110_NYTH15672 [Nymphaea thermarum]
MVGKVIIGNGDGGRGHDRIDEPIGAVGQRAVIDPDVAGPEYRDPVTVCHSPPPVVARRAPDQCIASRLAVMDVYAMDDDVGDILDGDAGAIGDVNVGTTAVNGLEALLLEDDDHVALEHDPKGLVLDDGVTEGPWPGVHGVVVRGVGHHVVASIAAANGVAPEPDTAVGEPLAVARPIGVAPPAVVDGVTGSAGKVTQLPPRRAVPDAPGKKSRVFESTTCRRL